MSLYCFNEFENTVKVSQFQEKEGQLNDIQKKTHVRYLTKEK